MRDGRNRIHYPKPQGWIRASSNWPWLDQSILFIFSLRGIFRFLSLKPALAGSEHPRTGPDWIRASSDWPRLDQSILFIFSLRGFFSLKSALGFENCSCRSVESWRVTIRAVQRVQGAVLDTLGRHSVFWELLFCHFREAERVLGAKLCFQEGPKSFTKMQSFKAPKRR